jgi:hypothetical protein
MSDSRIPVAELAREWLQDPEFRAEYDTLEDEDALATALIEARTRAALTQAEVAVPRPRGKAPLSHAPWERGLGGESTLRRSNRCLPASRITDRARE